MGGPISDAIDALSQKIDQMTTVEQSAVALINGLADQLRANKDSPAAILALADKLDSASNDLAAAVAANT